jgi:predicted porin
MAARCVHTGFRLAAAVATLVALGTNATTAADLGGSCCADLEERIAELEATTARKGNRKVSLTISGYVAQAVTYWDDGGEANTYLWGLGPTQTSHVKFTGQAQIAPGWTAGYVIRIQNLSDNPFGSSQARPNARDDLNTQMSYWYIQSKDLGKISMGQQAHAGKSAAMFTDQSGTQIISSYVLFDGAGFQLRRADGTLAPVTWGNLGFCYSQARPWGGDCNGIVNEGVRYDSPTFAGFTLSASWAEDDFWEVAGRYAGEVAGFKLLAGIAYSENTDERNQPPAAPFAGFAVKDSNYFQVGGYAQHLATGLFLHAAYGREDNSETVLLTGVTPPDSEHWTVKAGIRQKWTALGTTILWGEYTEYDDQIGPAALAAGATSSEFTKWGGGVAQEIDAAAMTLWLKYRRQEADIEAPAAAGLDAIEDLHMVTGGGMINF